MSVQYKVKPIQMISPPSDYALLPDNSWVVTKGKADTLWLSLNKVDVLGERHFVLPSGASFQVIFPRADSVTHTTPGSVSVTSQSIIKSASPNAEDRSLFNFALTSQEASNIVGGSVRFRLTVGSVITEWVQNYVVRKISADVAV